jgi:transposase-like protein
MVFNEQIKKEVRQKAAYQCCRCRSFGVEVHHIIPEENNGPDTIENAAPLCPNCHNDFGNNQKKRKIIVEMRDWWYETVEQMFRGQPGLMDLMQKIDKQTDEIVKSHSQDVSELKSLLKELSNRSIENITPKNASTATSAAITATRLASGVHANVKCHNCGTTIGLLIGSNNCPNCKAPIS